MLDKLGDLGCEKLEASSFIGSKIFAELKIIVINMS